MRPKPFTTFLQFIEPTYNKASPGICRRAGLKTLIFIIPLITLNSIFMKAFKTLFILLALLAATPMSGAELAATGDADGVQWLNSRTAELYLNTGENYCQYTFDGDGTRHGESMPGSVDMLAINFFSLYYNLAEDVEIVNASLRYAICIDGESEYVWNTIECNEVNTLVSSRTNTYRSTFNEQKMISRDLYPGDYVLRIMFDLTDANGQHYYLGQDNDNFVFPFSINDVFPDILGISMSMTLIPGGEIYPWAEAGQPFEPIDLTGEDPLVSMVVDEVIVFAQGQFAYIDFRYDVCDENGADLYEGYIPCLPDDFGNWSSDTNWSYELLDNTKLQNGKTYTLRFLAEGEAADDQLHSLDNDYIVKFVFGGQGTVTPGDLDGSGVVDVGDLNIIINFMLGKMDTDPGADLNGDGNVDIDDMNRLINIMLGKG